jgi:Protein of unknown function (DUF3617)
MKILPGAKIVFPFLLSFATLGLAQTAKTHTPPVKMGLWEEDVTTTITGVQGVTAGPQKDVEQSCISPESWKHGLQGNNISQCETLNLHQTPHKMSYDERCGSQKQGFLVFHMDILIDSEEYMHGTAVAKITGSSTSQEGTWTSTVTEHYIAPDCGNLKPGEKKSLKQ